MLNEKGTIMGPVPLGKDVVGGKYGIEVAASVVDFDGRVSSESSVYQADPDFLVGISNHPSVVKPGEGQTLAAIVLDRKGTRVTKGEVQVQVMERGYTYIQKRNAEGYLYHEQQQVWRAQLAVELPIKDERAVFDFDFVRGGEYLISFTYKAPNGKEYTSATKYSMPGYYDYGYEEDGGRRSQPQNYGKLSLYPERPLYTSGETIKIFLNPPREISTCLVTIEQGGLLEHRIMELKPGQRSIELPVKDSWNPNIYVSVLATVPRSALPVYTAQFDTDAPSFLFGTVNVEVKGGQQKIKISVNEEQKKIKSLPGAELSLTVVTTDQEGKGLASEVALAVVDESILSMTGYETPTLDALAKFLVPLGVFTGDLRLELLKQTPYGFFRNAPLTGGDGDESAGPAELELVERLVARWPALADERGWGARFGRELNRSDDRSRFSSGRTGMPVIEAKHVDPFCVRLEDCDLRLASPDGLPGRNVREAIRRHRLAYRDVASATNRLTLISAIVPFQLLACELARRKGLPPERMRYPDLAQRLRTATQEER